MRTRLMAALSVAVLLVGPHARAGEPKATDDWGRWVHCDDDGDQGNRHCEERTTEWKSSGATLRVDGGENGGASVVGWDQDMVRVTAVITARGRSRDDADALAKQIRIRMDDDLITATGPEAGRDRNWSVVFRIWVPRKTDIDLQAQNGPVGAHGITGMLRLVTHNGPMSLVDVSGDVVGRTQNGPVQVRLKGRRWIGAGLDAETINGPVSLEIPEHYSASLESGTRNGPSNIDLPVRTRRGRWFTAELGEGGKPIRVVTHNGPVKIESQ